MSQQPRQPARQRTGGRSARVREAVATAVLALLAEGDLSFSPTDLAARAGVTRATVYRWWPAAADLMAEALAQHTSTLRLGSSDRWHDDVRQAAHTLAAFAADPVELGISRVIATGRHPDLLGAVARHFGPVEEDWRVLHRAAVDRGEAAPGDPDALLDLLRAPLFLAPLMTGRAAPAADVDRVVDLVLAASRPGTALPPGGAGP